MEHTMNPKTSLLIVPQPVRVGPSLLIRDLFSRIHQDHNYKNPILLMLDTLVKRLSMIEANKIT